MAGTPPLPGTTVIDFALAGKLTTVAVASIALLIVIIKRAREYAKPRQITVEAQQVESRARVLYLPQHNPGVSVGEWTDEHAVDPAYDAIEAIRGK
jgi:hypothetical protein